MVATRTARGICIPTRPSPGLAVLAWGVQASRRDAPGRFPSPRHRLHRSMRPSPRAAYSPRRGHRCESFSFRCSRAARAAVRARAPASARQTHPFLLAPPWRLQKPLVFLVSLLWGALAKIGRSDRGLRQSRRPLFASSPVRDDGPCPSPAHGRPVSVMAKFAAYRIGTIDSRTPVCSSSRRVAAYTGRPAGPGAGYRRVPRCLITHFSRSRRGTLVSRPCRNIPHLGLILDDATAERGRCSRPVRTVR